MELFPQDGGLYMKEVSISTTVLVREGTEDYSLPEGLEMIAQAVSRILR